MSISHDQVLTTLRAAVDTATAENARIAAVVVDTGGRVVGSIRMDGVGFVQHDAAMRKAVTSAAFGAPTAMMAEMMGGDPKLAPVLSDPSLLVLAGGAPLRDGPTLVGGLGIAGGHYAQDQTLLEKILSA
jgi:glc operon protein GlcG